MIPHTKEHVKYKHTCTHEYYIQYGKYKIFPLIFEASSFFDIFDIQGPPYISYLTILAFFIFLLSTAFYIFITIGTM